MTPAERQRRCRANGKGRHRGKRYTRAEIRQIMEARAAAEQQAADPSAAPEAPPLPSQASLSSTQEPSLTMIDLSISSMAA